MHRPIYCAPCRIHSTRLQVCRRVCMGLCRNAVAQKLRSGFEPGKRLDNRIVELYKMRPSSTANVAVHGSYSWFSGCILNANVLLVCNAPRVCTLVLFIIDSEWCRSYGHYALLHCHNKIHNPKVNKCAFNFKEFRFPQMKNKTFTQRR